MKERDTITLDSRTSQANSKMRILAQTLDFEDYESLQSCFESKKNICVSLQKNEQASFKKQSIPAEICTKIEPC